MKKLVQLNYEIFIESRILTLILANLDNVDLVLSQNAFDCFLLLMKNKRFKEICKIEKAVIPKFLFLVRKKLLLVLYF